MVLIWRLMELERKSGKELNTERVSFMGVFYIKIAASHPQSNLFSRNLQQSFKLSFIPAFQMFRYLT